MRKLVLIVCVMAFLSSSLFGQTKEEKAFEYGKEAIQLMDKGEFEKSIELLEKAQKLDPKRIDYPYEIAYAHYLQKDYQKSSKILKKLLSHENVTELHFQLLGNCYDNMKEPDKAIETYQKGLEKFPNSGRLYLEQGIVEYFRENYNEAITYWEKGVEVQPTFPSNYYWLGKIFSFTDERIWSVLYGEMFMNLERNSKRTVEMSQILFETYKKSINIESDSSGSVSFTKSMTMNVSKGFSIPFQMAYEMNMTFGLIANILGKDKEASLASLNGLRQSFVSTWFSQKKDKDYPNVLFDYQEKLKKKGYLEAYNYWLLMKGNEEEFTQWYAENEEKFNEFAEWFTENPLEVNKKAYFSRLNY